MRFVSGLGSIPPMRTSPAVGVSRPFASLISVLLPEPFGPSRPTMRPGMTGKRQPVQRRKGAVLLAEPSAFKNRHHNKSPLFSGSRTVPGKPPAAAPASRVKGRPFQSLFSNFLSPKII